MRGRRLMAHAVGGGVRVGGGGVGVHVGGGGGRGVVNVGL